MKTQIPIYRGKKMGSNEDVEGWLLPNNEIVIKIEPEHNNYWASRDFSGNLTIRSKNQICIDPSTLEISFDDGVTWRSVEFVAKLLKEHDLEVKATLASMNIKE